MRFSLPSVTTATPPSMRVDSTSCVDHVDPRSQLYLSFGVRILPRPQQEAHRRALQFESLAQAVLQIAQIGLGQRLQLVAEQREGRRPRLELGHVADAHPPAR